MPIYKSQRQLKKVELPSIKGSEVEIYTSLLYGEIEKIYLDEKSDLVKAIEALSILIKEWNLTDDSGNKLPITAESLRGFDVADITFLLSQTDFSESSNELGKKKVTGEGLE